MTLRENMQRDVDVVMLDQTVYGRQVEYHFGATDTSAVIPASVFYEDEDESNYSGDGRKRQRQASVLVSFTDVPDPSTADWMIIDGERWNVGRIDDSGVRVAGTLLRIVARYPLERSSSDLRRSST